MMGGMPRKSLIFIVPLAMLVLSSCQTPQERRAAENAAINKKAAEEFARICALHGEEREAALRNFREISGLELYCSGE